MPALPQQVEIPHTATRLAGGGTSGAPVLLGDKTTGVLAGVEQSLGQRWIFQPGWSSGRHDLVYKFHPHWMASFGYRISNRLSHGCRAAVLELTRF